MILGFRVSNYRSFRSEASISLTATRLDTEVGIPVQIADDGATVQALPVLAILGANASGKSNLLRALSFMRDLVVYSSSTTPFDSVERDHFRFDPKCADEPTFMEMDFALRGCRYVYGFELRKSTISAEWLFAYPHKRAQTVFEREGNEYQFGKRLSGSKVRAISEITRPTTLFLSTAATARQGELVDIYDYFLGGVSFLDVQTRSNSDAGTIARLMRRRKQIVGLLAMADLGILDATVERVGLPESQISMYRKMIADSLPEGLTEEERERQIIAVLDELDDPKDIVELVHRGDAANARLPFDEESLGTKSWINFIVHALEALERGGALLVDELDASLHPLLMMEAIQMFQNPKTNVRHAQLIFTTHDTTLLGPTEDQLPLSRGQFWFAEKDSRGQSSLTPLSDYRPRKGEDLERGYRQGRYGGAPKIVRRSVAALSAPDRHSRGQ